MRPVNSVFCIIIIALSGDWSQSWRKTMYTHSQISSRRTAISHLSPEWTDRTLSLVPGSGFVDIVGCSHLASIHVESPMGLEKMDSIVPRQHKTVTEVFLVLRLKGPSKTYQRTRQFNEIIITYGDNNVILN